jgi:hypothetical protein
LLKLERGREERRKKGGEREEREKERYLRAKRRVGFTSPMFG